jgi:subtilisin family serine protease
MSARRQRAGILAVLASAMIAGHGPAAPPPSRDHAATIHPALAELASQAAGPVKAWVFFSDKGLAGPAAKRAAIDELASTFDARAVARRQARRTAPGLFDERDLPVSAAYVAAVTDLGAVPHVTSRWLNAISARMTMEQARRIADLPFVRRIEPVRRGRLAAPPPRGERPGPSAVAGSSFHGLSEEQLEQIGVIELHERGFTGAGVFIGVLDTGFKRTHEAFNHPDHPLQVITEYDFVDQDFNAGIDPGDPSSQHNHGTLILGLLAAYEPGVLVGAAPDAAYILCKTEDTTDEYQGEEDNYVGGLELIESSGGDIATSSLGYIDWYTQADLDGLTAVTTIAVNAATDNGVFCCTAAGNSGHDANPLTSRLIAPADALAVITCGAVNSEGEPAWFTSDGPSADGRVKPELVARGVNSITISSSNDTQATGVSGTSASTPLVAGAVACLVQARPGWSIAQMREMLFATASHEVEHGGSDPLFVQGYGIIDAVAAADLDCNGNGIADPEDLLAGGSSDTNGNGRPDECDADIDGNGVIDVDDLVLVFLAWGPCPLPECPEDVDASGAVDIDDVIWIILNWS